MQQTDKDKIIQNIQTITEEENISLITLLVNKAEQDILNFCYIPEITPQMFYMLEDLAIYKFASIGKENLTSENLSSYSTSFRDDIPDSLKTQLLSFKRPKRLS